MTSEAQDRPCIFFQPTNGIGLGHVSRLAAIALALASRSNAPRILFGLLGESHTLLEEWGLPCMMLPVGVEVGGKHWAAWSETERRNLGVTIAEATLRAVKPSLVVFDCVPSYSFAISALFQGYPIAMCVREVRDFREYYKRVGPLLEAARAIIVPHEFSEWALPEQLMDKTHFVGPITRPFAIEIHPESVAEGDILVTGGGGGFPGTVNFYNTAIQAFARCRDTHPQVNLRCVLVTGPLFREWRQLVLIDGVQVVPVDPDVIGMFAKARLVVTQGGYNTLGELSALGVPTVCVPAFRILDDQRKRALAMARRLPGFRVCQNLEARELSLAMRDALSTPIQSRRFVQPSGASKAAGTLIETVQRIGRSPND